MNGRFVRLAETGRANVTIYVDGEAVTALAGDTLMVAMLGRGRHRRASEFGDDRRAGFCLMGACQDCWVWTASGERLRACTMVALEGLAVLTRAPEERWPSLLG